MRSSNTQCKFIQQGNYYPDTKIGNKYFRRIRPKTLVELSKICGQATRKCKFIQQGNYHPDTKIGNKYFRRIHQKTLVELTKICGQATRNVSYSARKLPTRYKDS